MPTEMAPVASAAAELKVQGFPPGSLVFIRLPLPEGHREFRLWMDNIDTIARKAGVTVLYFAQGQDWTAKVMDAQALARVGLMRKV